jgi:hypothetical protein
MNQQLLIKRAWLLSIAGLLPFSIITIEIWSGVNFFADIFSANAEFVFFGYGAAILSFLGGIMWAFALNIQGKTHLAIWLLTLSVCPPLVAWCSLMLQPENIAWILLLGGFLSQLKIEHILMQLQIIPNWFWQLRLRISLIVCSLILLNFLHFLTVK